MSYKKCYLYGAGGHSNVVAEVLATNGYEVPCKFDDDPGRSEIAKPGILLNGTDSFPVLDGPLIITVGRNEERAYLTNHLDVEYATAIHPTAIVSPSATIGEGTVVLHGALIQARSSIGMHALINTAASVDHDNIIGDFAHISPHATLCGHVEIGEGTHVGAGATIIPKVKIGKWCTVGAGAVVLRDVPDFSTVVGNPARVIESLNLPRRFFQESKIGITEFDVVFVGAGLSSTMLLINLLKRMIKKQSGRKINIAMIEKSGEFFAGIAYGERAGSNSLIITSLKDFLPEPHLSQFKYWLNKNLDWLFDKFNQRKGPNSSAWMDRHKEKIYQGKWDSLFVPRYLFGLYLNEKANQWLNEAKRLGLVKCELIASEVTDIVEVNGAYSIRMASNKKIESNINSRTVVLGLGSPPIKRLFDTGELDLQGNACLIDNQYDPGLQDSIDQTICCLERHRPGKKNVLLVGSNASAIETLYNLNDAVKARVAIEKFYVVSQSGQFPERLRLPKRAPQYVPRHLKEIQLASSVTAQQIYEAARDDVNEAQTLGLTFSDTFEPIGLEVGKLLSRLDEPEKLKFANVYGVEIGKLQRRAGDEYSDVVDALIAEGKLEFVVGRFEGCDSADQQGIFFRYSSADGQEHVFPQPICTAINCGGFETNSLEGSSDLMKNLLRRGICEATPSGYGLVVNDQYQASKNVFIAGPMLAGNLINGKPIWHVEHCGRIIEMSAEIAEHLFSSINVTEKLVAINGLAQF